MAIVRDRAGYEVSVDKPMDGANFAIVPSDVDRLSFPPDEIYVGGAGNITAKDVSGATVTFSGVPAGTSLKSNGIVQVLATGTTATNMIGRGNKNMR